MPTPKLRRDETLIKALVRAHCWRRRTESGPAKSITDLAKQERVTDAYVCRFLPLTCLAPDIVEAILDGRQPKRLRLAGELVPDVGRAAIACVEFHGGNPTCAAPVAVDIPPHQARYCLHSTTN